MDLQLAIGISERRGCRVVDPHVVVLILRANTDYGCMEADARGAIPPHVDACPRSVFRNRKPTAEIKANHLRRKRESP